ncbi:MAG: hypothetical protein Q9160_001161 [Pyrenula sp. 1 TL-2023]
MSLPNGVTKDSTPTPSSPVLSAIGKRKRSASPQKQCPSNDSSLEHTDIRQLLQNVLRILRRHEADLWILQYSLPPPSEPQPHVKRPRIPSQTDNIESRIESGYYNGISEVLEDVQSVETAKRPTGNEQTVPHNESLQQISCFKHKLDRLLRQNQAWENKNHAEGKAEQHSSSESTRDGRSVLTLWGNTGNGSKQLFSSFQQPADNGEVVKLNGAGLPNGISMATITAFNSQERKKDQKSALTIGDIFKPSHNVKPLETPKQSKNLTRGSSLTWGPITEGQSMRPAYVERGHALPAGQWLNYSETVNTVRPPSPEEKRRQRERALSFGETKAELRGDEGYDTQNARDKSLFQAAYTSFAPAYDSTDSVVPEQIRRRMWWSKVGHKKFNALFTSQYPEDGLKGESAVIETDDPVESFAEVVASFVEDDKPKEFFDDVEASPKEVDEILEEITGLLSTLSSYQRIRNLSTPRPGTRAGNLSTPSKDEIDIYELLRSQLLAMIANLPPYAVAKLDGNQLESLNVAPRILVQSTDFTGTMEPDQVTIRKQQATSNSAPNRVNTPTTTQRPNYQALNAAGFNSRAYGSNGKMPSSTPNYQQGQYRQPNQYSSLAASHPNSRGSVSSQRPNFSQQYNQTSTSTQYQTPTVQQFQRPTVNGYNSNYGNQQGSGSPFQRLNQQPTRNDSGMYGRSASPQKSTTDYSPYPQRNTPQPQYPPRSGSNPGIRPPYQPSTPQNGPSNGPSNGPPNGPPNGPSQTGAPQTPNGQTDNPSRIGVDGKSNGTPVATTNGT